WAERKAAEEEGKVEKPGKAGKRKREGGEEAGGGEGVEKKLKVEGGAVAAVGEGLNDTLEAQRVMTWREAVPVMGTARDYVIGTAPPPEASEEGRPVVHVSNLALDSDEAALVTLLQVEKERVVRDKFGGACGVAPGLTVENVRVVRDKFGGHKGFAYVDLENDTQVAAAVAAAEARSLAIGGRKVDVSRARALHAHKDKITTDPETLYIQGLTDSASKESIKALFAPCGEVLEVRLMRDREGALRGFCYVEFKDANGAAAGLSKHNEDFQGKRLKVAKP
ncbi:hypothetical protein T484DRAFT_1825145, partial [Baffinella frigidus]